MGELDAAGWTVLSPSEDTQIIYVSSSRGDDANSGLSAAAPVKTLDKGYELVRDGYPDWLLLRRGDIWNEAFNSKWQKSGRSQGEPMVISGYGTGRRPEIRPGIEAPLRIIAKDKAIGLHHLAFVGLDFYADSRDPNSPTFNPEHASANAPGVWVGTTGGDILIENCRMRFFRNNITVKRPTTTEDITLRLKNVRLRRNVITDAYTTATGGTGLFASDVVDLLVEGNVFDHNGWNDAVDGAEPTVFNHNIYLVECRHATVEANISSRASLNGLKLRSESLRAFSGLRVANNLFAANAAAISMSSQMAEGISHEDMAIHDNIVTKPGRVVNGIPVARGMSIVAVAQIAISDNYFIHKYFENGGVPISIKDLKQVDLDIRTNVIHNWHLENLSSSTIVDEGDGQGVTIEDNYSELSDSRYFDASRSVGSYYASIGGKNSLEAFLVRAAKQSARNWDDLYTAPAVVRYIKSGFTVLPDFD